MPDDVSRKPCSDPFLRQAAVGSGAVPSLRISEISPVTENAAPFVASDFFDDAQPLQISKRPLIVGAERPVCSSLLRMGQVARSRVQFTILPLPEGTVTPAIAGRAERR